MFFLIIKWILLKKKCITNFRLTTHCFFLRKKGVREGLFVEHRDRRRTALRVDAVDKRPALIVLPQVAVQRRHVGIVPECPEHAGLEIVRAGDIRHGAGDGVLVRREQLIRLPGIGPRQQPVGQRVEVRRLGEPRRRTTGLSNAVLVVVGVVQDIAGIAGLEQELARNGRRPLALRDVVENRIALGGRDVGEDRQAGLSPERDFVPFRLEVPLVGERKLVLLRGLVRAAYDEALDPGVFDAWRAVAAKRVRNEDVGAQS